MQYDTLIIGGGLAGLTCGIRLTEQGQHCAIVSAGQSSLHFSSGSLNLLNTLPDGTPLEQPIEAYNALTLQAPEHPYSRLGKERFINLSAQAQSLLVTAGINIKGSNKKNHQRITSLGTPRPAWLSCSEMAMYAADADLPWQRIAVVSIEGFMDFQPELAAGALCKQGADAKVVWLNLPFLDRLRNNASEFRSANIAVQLNSPQNFSRFVVELAMLAQQVDAIILPACFGLNNSAQRAQLLEQVNIPVMMVPTLPPSLAGQHIYQQLHHNFLSNGGIYMPGDAVLRGELADNRVMALYTRNHTDIPLCADNVVLATGSFFNNGLLAAYDRVYEPVFGLDVFYDKDRANWVDSNFFKPQSYMKFGVQTDEQFHGIINGQVIDNLYAVGAVLGGFDALHQGCGAGVSLLTALQVAEQILIKQGGTYEPAA